MTEEMLSESPLKKSRDFNDNITAMEELTQSLLRLSLPPITDRTMEPRSSPTEEITICILGSSKRHLDILLEGGDCCPGDIMLVISPSWLKKVPFGPDRSQRNQHESAVNGPSQDHPPHLLVHQAIVFARGGSTYLDVFNPPRRVTYVINDMSDVFDTSDVECSMNGTQPARAVLGNILFWKAEMTRIGEVLPSWILLCRQPSLELKEKAKRIEGGKVFDLSAERESDKNVPEELEEFLTADAYCAGDGKIIVTTRLNDQTDVKTWLTKNRRDLIKQVLQDAERMGGDDYFFIEYIQPVRMHQKESLRWRSRSIGPTACQKSFHVTACVSACRGLDDLLLQSQIYASLIASNGASSDPMYYTLETTLGDLGITEVSRINDIKNEINRQVRAVMDKIIDTESCYHHLYIGPRTDFIDIEFSIGDVSGAITPILQAVRDQRTILEVGGVDIRTRTPNYGARNIVHVMAMRSHCLLLKDHRMLFLSASLHGHNDIWLAARKYGMKMIVVTPKTDEETDNFVEQILYDFEKDTENSQHAKNILALLKERNCTISGCFSRNTRFSLIAAIIREEIGARGPSLDACQKTHEKTLTLSTLSKTPSRILLNKAIRVTTLDEMKDAVKHIEFPAVVKFDTGSGAIGAGLVQDEQSCLKYYQNLLEEIKHNHEVFEMVPSTTVIIMKYIDGTEHNVDLVLFEGRLLASFVRDVAPPSLPSFVATAVTLPSNLPKDKLNSLISASFQTCRDIGITNGCINVDMKMTTRGPRLLEINPRYGGHAIVPFAKRCFDEDLMILTYAISCGIRPTVVGLKPLRKAYALMLRAPHHCQFLKTPWVLARLKDLCDKGMITYFVKREIKETSYDKVIAYIGVSDEDGQKAKQTLHTISQTLGVDKPGFDSAYFLDHL